VFKKFHRYATVLYFDIKNLVSYHRKIIEIMLKDYSKKQGYLPST
jgi:hypothetical protein